MSIESIGEDCCGCGNCSLICPHSAIDMISDLEGFLIPSINISCVDCGACLKACPQTKILSEKDTQNGYIAITNDNEVLSNATSGGVFGTIAKRILQMENGYICAASFVEGSVKHIITQNISDLKKCQGSKYVQSSLNDCFKRLRDILKNENSVVLFCGTPCQVAALYSYLRKKPENLFTLDLVCHGVPSPKYLDKNIRHYCKYSKELRNVKFRWRNPLKPKGKSGYILEFETIKNTRLYSSSYDPYFLTFMRGESFRNSCYCCHYANLNRVGNITIGDCDSSRFYPHFHPSESKSTVIINNSHGQELWDKVKDMFDFVELDIKREADYNHQLSHPFVRPLIRDDIYKDVESYSFVQMKNKYASPKSKQQRILSYVQTYTPFLYKLLLYKYL